MDVGDDYPFDIGLISATRGSFWEQMKYIKTSYRPISMSELVNFFEKGIKLPRKSILVTFDDGFDDNYHTAFPILKELDIPATIFVTTDFINSTETIWYERLAYFFNKVSADQIYLSKLDEKVTLDDDLKTRRSRYAYVIEKLKLVQDKVRNDILNDLYSEYGDPYVSISPDDKKLSISMTWDELREMQQNNIEIGSHTVSHPILSMLNEEQLGFEIGESKKIIENQLQESVDTIAYPVGQFESYSNNVINATKSAGYKIGFSYIDAMNNLKMLNRYSVPRLHVDMDSPLSLFKSKLCLPEVFCE